MNKKKNGVHERTQEKMKPKERERKKGEEKRKKESRILYEIL